MNDTRKTDTTALPSILSEEDGPGTPVSRARTVKKLPEETALFPPNPREAQTLIDSGATTAEMPELPPLPDTDVGEPSGTFKRDATVSKSLDEFIQPSEATSKACLIVMRGHQVGRMYELGEGVLEIGRSHDAAVSIADDAVSRTHAKVHSSKLGYVITDLHSTNGLFVNAQKVSRQVLRDGDRVQFGTSTVLKFTFQDELEETLQQKLYDGATRDQLVGAHNRQYLVDNLGAQFAIALRRKRALSVQMLDIDHFKLVNDTYGHLAGDHILKGVAKLIQEAIRTEDVFARYGGEEFVLLLPESEREGAVLVAERIRSGLESQVFEYEGAFIRVTISIGVATFMSHNYRSPKALIAAADAALYEAKRGGRNRVVWSQRTAPPEATRAGHS